MKEAQDVERAQVKVQEVEAEIAALNADLEREIAALEAHREFERTARCDRDQAQAGQRRRSTRRPRLATALLVSGW